MVNHHDHLDKHHDHLEDPLHSVHLEDRHLHDHLEAARLYNLLLAENLHPLVEILHHNHQVNRHHQLVNYKQHRSFNRHIGKWMKFSLRRAIVFKKKEFIFVNEYIYSKNID